MRRTTWVEGLKRKQKTITTSFNGLNKIKTILKFLRHILPEMAACRSCRNRLNFGHVAASDMDGLDRPSETF